MFINMNKYLPKSLNVYLFFLFCFVTLQVVYSQPSITWQRTYGNHYLNQPETFGIDVCPADGGNFYVTSTNPNPNSFNIIKINAYGDTLWTRTIDSIRNNYAGCTSSGDGGVICTGDGAFAVRYDKEGNRLWWKSFGFQALCYKIMRTSDGSVVICGQYNGWYGLVFKVDLDGNLIWMKSYNTTYWGGWYNYIIEANDNNYVAVGFRRYSENDTLRGLVTKLDTAGNIIWEKEYILFNGWTIFVSVDRINLGYILTYEAHGSQIVNGVVALAKIDEFGTLIFAKRFSADSNWTYIPTDIKKINQNKYLLCSNGYHGLDSVDSKIYTTDSLGNIIQQRLFREYDYEQLNRAFVINNADVIFAGSSDHVNPNYSDTWVVRMDSNLYSPPIGIKINELMLAKNFRLLQNYPNPFNSSTIIEFDVSTQANVVIKVYNVLGEEITVLINGTCRAGKYKSQFNGTSLSSGVYFYSLVIDNRLIESRKMLLIK